jgi:hypothetical protein
VFKIATAANSLALACLVCFSQASASTLFINPLADGSIPDPPGVSYNLNGNCTWQCYGVGGVTRNEYMGDNFSLKDNSIIGQLGVVTIRTGAPYGSPPPFPNLDFQTNISWLIYQTVGVNSGTPVIGVLEAQGSGIAQYGVPTYPAGPNEAFLPMQVDLPDVALSGGNYFIAMHADITGYDGFADNTALYLANGYGDGIWAWGAMGDWKNPNPSLPDGGLAFALHGSSVTVPEPGSLMLVGVGLTALPLARRLRKGSRQSREALPVSWSSAYEPTRVQDDPHHVG